ncbi:hypothetical protein SteCoe_20863 [Stentor coeruleus]|uniref:non-specific serine/threonine protein kinase n=1 Tax=Stentor coeruleus TaxID=5963 RepID=A0A1R2BQZ4_9CILI|nr:hypothetical protein SteCoe_20863 [Stentor coeruleus]
MNIHLRRQWFISSKLYDIKSEYDFLEETGNGAFGKVYKCKHIDSGILRAIKVIQKIRVNDYKTFITEIEILKTLDHPNIINIIETFESEHLCYLVLEFYSGGDLFDRIIQEKRFSEQKAAAIMRSLFSAIMYCHANNVCHRDLKPENLLYITTDPNSDIKIIDFGLSVVTNELDALHDMQGTPYYIAPEVLAENYNKLADCWSLGVILYMLLSGTMPFKGKNNQEILMNVYNGSLSFRPKVFKTISFQAKDLISRLLVKDPTYRLTAAQAFSHEWISGNCIIPTIDLPISTISNITKYVRSQNLKKTALMFLASKLDLEEIQNLREQFISIDKNGDGVISKDEVIDVLKTFEDLVGSDMTSIMNGIDINGNGVIDYTEFITACLSAQNMTNKGLLMTAFKYFDKDNSGFITYDELKEAFSGNDICSNRSLGAEMMMKEADLNNDGKIDYKEFLSLLSVKSIL